MSEVKARKWWVQDSLVCGFDFQAHLYLMIPWISEVSHMHHGSPAWRMLEVLCAMRTALLELFIVPHVLTDDRPDSYGVFGGVHCCVLQVRKPRVREVLQELKAQH